MSDKTTDLIIVGGGIMGLMNAYYAVKAGLHVHVIEQGQCFKEASWAAAGILSAMYPWRYPDEITSLIETSQNLYPRLCEDLQLVSGVDPEYFSSGLMFTHHEESNDAFRWAQEKGVSSVALNLSEINGLKVDSEKQRCLLPTVASVRSPRLGQALVAYLKLSKYFTLSENTSFVNIVSSSTSQVKIQTNRTQLSAHKLLYCAGPWLENLLSDNVAKKLMPVKGEIILYQAEPNLLPHILMFKGRYIVPRKDGLLLVGSTLELTGFDKSLSLDNKNSLQQFAIQALPQLKELPVINHWSGLRPGTEDGLPVMMALSDMSGEAKDNNSFVCGGHFKNGIAMAPAVAKKMMGLMYK